MRATSSVTISFGLVVIPTKLYTACVEEKAQFHMINPATGNRLKQQYIDSVTSVLADRNDTLKGYEISKDQCVTFTKEEIAGLEADRTGSVDVKEFVPMSSIDLTGVEKSYYIGPGKGADKAYILFSQVMQEQNTVAVGRWATRGKDELVIIRPYNGGLILHQMFYSNEIRSYEEVYQSVAKVTVSDKEKNLAVRLIEQMSSSSYDSSKYRDEFAERVLEAAQRKIAGTEQSIFTAPKEKETSDLFEALKLSIERKKVA